MPRGRPAHDRDAAPAARSSTSRRCCRSRAASRVPATPPPRAASCSSPRRSPTSGRRTASTSTPSRPATCRPTTPRRCATDPQRNRQITERIPAGRWGTPDDLAGAARVSRVAGVRLRARPRARGRRRMDGPLNVDSAHHRSSRTLRRSGGADRGGHDRRRRRGDAPAGRRVVRVRSAVGRALRRSRW